MKVPSSRYLKIIRFIESLILIMLNVFNFMLIFSIFVVALLFMGALAADSLYNNGLFTAYTINTIFARDMITQIFPVVSIMSSTYFKYFFWTVFAGLILLKIRVRWTYKHRFFLQARIKRRVRFLIKNFFLNIGVLSITITFVISLIFMGYVNRIFSTGDHTKIASETYMSKINIVKLQVADQRAAATIALHKIMSDVDQDEEILQQLSFAELRKLCTEVNALIESKNGPETPEEHHFRNKLNRAPATLDEMKRIIIQEPDQETGITWVLMSLSDAQLHMNGKDGEYNLKFVTSDGLFEAVYNKEGELLTEDNDPANMGTYNYADPLTQKSKHALYDVAPYTMWGNTFGLQLNLDEMVDNVEKFNNNVYARYHYDKVKAEINGERPIEPIQAGD